MPLLLAPFVEAIVKYGVIALAVLGVIFGVKRLLTKAGEADTFKRTLEVTRESKKLDNRIRAMPDAQLDDELRKARDRHKSKGWS